MSPKNEHPKRAAKNASTSTQAIRGRTSATRDASGGAAAEAAGGGGLTVKAYRGDAKTLLAFDLPKASAKRLAGFTVACQPEGQAAYFLHNTLELETPGDHAQDAKEPSGSSVNAPFQKFRWVHVPGSVHRGIDPSFGQYTYTVTPRYFDGGGALQPLDASLGVSVAVLVGPFEKGNLKLGFTRGYTQSQAFVGHFGKDAVIQPKGADLAFDTSAQAGKNALGETFTFEDEYRWLGSTARKRVLDVLSEVAGDASLALDVFAYDLNEPAVVTALLQLAEEGRVRVILDDASLHKSTAKKAAPEDEVEERFAKARGGKAADDILRGHFKRYAHDKVLIVRDASGARTARKVLTGSTNLSVTGLYVNSNHVLVFEDASVAATYAEVFDEVWSSGVKEAAFVASPLSRTPATFGTTTITFSPHDADTAEKILDDLVARAEEEGSKPRGSVLFAVMQLDKGTGPVYPALRELHAKQDTFTYGISDTPGGVQLYKPGQKSGLLVTGKPSSTRLPAPFNQVPGIHGLGHQIHHKFVVCGFNGDDPVVYCGSSNLALGGEQENGDNLLAIRDGDVATVFAIEALLLVDHFNFLDRFATETAKGRKGAKAKKAKIAEQPAPTNKSQAASDASWHLAADDGWTKGYYDKNDLHFTDRVLFAQEP
jgi:phosphatidylserine/phosphatidylglycerophosphate/cardiolipin synthase-like enzyme